MSQSPGQTGWGAFQFGADGWANLWGGNGGYYKWLNFAASSANSTYGSSETVTPLSMSCIFCTKY